MTNVYAWPPVGLVGWEFTVQHPVSRSETFPQGGAITSSVAVRRRLATAHVTGIGPDESGAGYVEVLKELIAGGRHLVCVPCHSGIWHLARTNLPNAIGTWLTGATPGLWMTSGTPGYWVTTAAHGTAATVDGWPAVAVTGLPPDTVVCRPHELVSLLHPTDPPRQARAMRLTRSDGDGNATIRLLSALTGSGPVSIGDTESIVFEALDMPRAVQPVGQNWHYVWNFREVFAAEYADGWTELDPWH